MANDTQRPADVENATDGLRPRLVTIETACRYLGGIADRTFYNYRKRQGIRPVQLVENGKPLFDLRDIDAAVDAAKAETARCPLPDEPQG